MRQTPRGNAVLRSHQAGQELRATRQSCVQVLQVIAPELLMAPDLGAAHRQVHSCSPAHQAGIPMLAHLGRHVGGGALRLQLHQALRDSLGTLLTGHQLFQGAQHLHKTLPLECQAHQAGDGLHAGSPAVTSSVTVRPALVHLLHPRPNDSAHSTKRPVHSERGPMQRPCSMSTTCGCCCNWARLLLPGTYCCLCITGSE